MFGPVKNVVFDFDGTLVNTMTRVTAGMSKAIAHVTGQVIPNEKLVASFGPSPQAVLAQWVPAEKLDEAFECWLEFDEASGPEAILPFEGVTVMLEDLQKRSFKIGVFTGRDRKSTLKILKAHGWYGKFFDEKTIACGDDGHAPKPSPEGLLNLLERMNLKPADTLMVGDHPHDMLSGKAAGCKTGAALWDTTTASGVSHRAQFKSLWERWGADSCDVRLPAPESLSAWAKF